MLLDEELHRIIMERREECMKLKAMNTTPPPGKVYIYISRLKIREIGRAREQKCEEEGVRW